MNNAQIIKDGYNNNKGFSAEHKQFQKVISTLERDVTDLKKEISERDSTIQVKEQRIYELKRKKQELEKYKFVLNFKITELKNQVGISVYVI